MTNTAQFSIGEFSARARLSVRMLRHYDANGVLAPATVDPVTGYRFYTAGQLDDALRVRRLRDAGLGVAAIAALLGSSEPDADRLALQRQREVLVRELRDAQTRIALIDHLISTEGHSMNPITVSQETFPAMTIAGLRGIIPSYPEEGQLWDRFMPLFGAAGLQPVGPGGVIEHDGEYMESDPDETVWIPVAPGSTIAAPAQILDLPQREVVVARFTGPYSLITEAHARIDEYARQHGIELAAGGTNAPAERCNFNRYLTEPNTAAPDAQRVEVYMPVA